jgi:hypothetical protein
MAIYGRELMHVSQSTLRLFTTGQIGHADRNDLTRDEFVLPIDLQFDRDTRQAAAYVGWNVTASADMSDPPSEMFGRALHRRRRPQRH